LLRIASEQHRYSEPSRQSAQDLFHHVPHLAAAVTEQQPFFFDPFLFVPVLWNTPGPNGPIV
ncbi:MAG: hypothetical protein PVG95_11865, partial [Methyloceanibacter sp.]